MCIRDRPPGAPRSAGRPPGLVPGGPPAPRARPGTGSRGRKTAWRRPGAPRSLLPGAPRDPRREKICLIGRKTRKISPEISRFEDENQLLPDFFDVLRRSR